MLRWTFENIPSQIGSIAIVTGANAGIGYETARALVHKGSRVILACRNEERGREAVRRIEAEHPIGAVEFKFLDLADLNSVTVLAKNLLYELDHVNLLINNAGVMLPPESKTKQGFELQFGVNYIGHFLLTGLLLDKLKVTPGARIVTISSLAHRLGRIDFNNLRCEKPYRSIREYAQSKLADLIFSVELNRRFELAGWGTSSVAAHPGFTVTDLQRHSAIANVLVRFWSNSAAQGALPTLYAATDPEAHRGCYYGPDGLFEVKGFPAPARITKAAQNRRIADHLWKISEDAADFRFCF